MKTINLIALGQFTIDDIAPFLAWLNKVPAIQRTADKMKKIPPVGSGKLSPMLKVLEQLRFIGKKQDVYSVAVAGTAFLNANPGERKSLMNAIFLNEEEAKRTVELLNQSKTGRVAKHLVNECFGLTSFTSTTETEILAFLSWAQACELFGYDKKKQEIFALDSGKPKGPVEVQHSNSQAHTLSRAA